MRKLSLFISAALLCAAAAAQADTFAVTGAKILSQGPAGDIDDGVLIVKDGKVAAVGAHLAIPAGVKVIVAKPGSILTPGFVAAATDLGLMEVDTVSDTVNTSSSNPDISASFDPAAGYNRTSIVIPVARLGGFTRALITPAVNANYNGGAHASLFGGQIDLAQLSAQGEPVERHNLGIVLLMGSDGAAASGGARGAEYARLTEAFDDVRFYQRHKALYEKGQTRKLSLSKADLEALIPVVQGKEPLLISISSANDIREALQYFKAQKVKIILLGAQEGWKVSEDIAAAKVPVLLNPLEDLPTQFEALGSRQDNAALLAKAGVSVTLLGNENAHRLREARYNAGNAVANGLPYAQALQALTLNPAKAFGVAERLGSLEPGKEADFVLWSGDPLEPLSQADAVYIHGVAQAEDSRPLRLRDRYLHPEDGKIPAYKK